MKVKVNVKRYFQVLAVALSVIVAAAAICMGINYDSFDNNGGGFGSDIMPDVDNGIINVLALGVDVEGLRTDAMMLFSFNTGTKEMNILTIPRDTKMYVGNRYQKVNAAHAFMKNGEIGGPEASVEAVQRVTGIPINYYAEFSFDAVAHVLNILGPIEFTIPDLYNDGVGMVYDDPIQSLHINLPPGKYGDGPDCDYPGLNGSQGVHLLRYRHGNADENGNFNGYTNGDEDRTKVQQEFIKAVVDQKLNAGLIMKIPELFQEISSEIKTNITFSDILKYAGNLTGVSSMTMHSYSLPGWFSEDDSNGDVWIVDIPATRDMVLNIFGYDNLNITINDPNGRDPEDVYGYCYDDYAGKEFNAYFDSLADYVTGISDSENISYSEIDSYDSVGGSAQENDGTYGQSDEYIQDEGIDYDSGAQADTGYDYSGNTGGESIDSSESMDSGESIDSGGSGYSGSEGTDPGGDFAEGGGETDPYDTEAYSEPIE